MNKFPSIRILVLMLSVAGLHPSPAAANEFSASSLDASRLSDIFSRINDHRSLQNALTEVEKLIADGDRGYKRIEAVHMEASKSCAKADVQAIRHVEGLAKKLTDLDVRFKAGAKVLQLSVDKVSADINNLPPGIEKFRRERESKDFARYYRELIRLGSDLTLQMNAYDRISKSLESIRRSCSPSRLPNLTSAEATGSHPSSPAPAIAASSSGKAISLCMMNQTQANMYFALRPGGTPAEVLRANILTRVSGEVGGKVCFGHSWFGPSECPLERSQEAYRCPER
jgi:uncharacterized protein YbcI